MSTQYIEKIILLTVINKIVCLKNNKKKLNFNRFGDINTDQITLAT